MKIVSIILVVILLSLALVLIFSPKAPKDVQELQVSEKVDEQNTEVITLGGVVELTNFSFIGYGPGKSHEGVFNDYEVRNVRVNSNGVPVAGELIVKTASVKTDAALLDQHLCEKPEFFDCVKYPEIKFVLSNTTEMGAGEFQVGGDLTVKDVTKRVSFIVKAQTDRTFSSEFRLNMNDFGFKAPGIVDDEALIRFAGKVN